MIRWIKKLFRIVENYNSDREALRMDIKEGVEFIRKMTTVHADVHMRHQPNQIIVIGKYRGQDFIQAYSTSPEGFYELIDHLRYLQKYAQVGKIDAVPNMSASIKLELEKCKG